jgi:CYTH domain-containing protein
MGTEIERKFLVRDASVVDGLTGTRYRQGYLSTDPERTVRVRRAGEQAFLTIKGLTQGATRSEFEYEIPGADGDALLGLCEPPLIEKTRYRIDRGGLTWEVDVFEGANAGLVVAEVELPSEDAPFDVPDWAGDEVTADRRYLNANLVRRPFLSWATEKG